MPRIVRGRVAIGTALVVLALAAGSMNACGGDDDGAAAVDLASAAPKVPPKIPAPPPPVEKSSPRWSTEAWGEQIHANERGVLVPPDGGKIRGWGDRRVRRYVTALFASIQYDFLTGDMTSVCRRIDSHLLTAFGATASNAPCEKTLTRYAQTLEERGFRSPPLRFLWVRTYPGVAGVWVEDHRGRRFRVPFSYEDDEWKLELTDLQPPEALGMPLRYR